MKIYARKRQLLPVLLLFALINVLTVFAADPVRTIDPSDVADNNTIVGVRGSFEQPAVDKIIARLNQIRQEACTKGYPNPNNPDQKLTMADYSPISWSGDMEVIAQTRAVEATLLQSHTRPNGRQPFTVTSNGVSSDSETLAWNYDGILKGIEQWYGEKNDWVKQNANEVTGHYTAMINPYAHGIGLGGFIPDDGGWQTVAGEFTMETDLSSAQLGMYGRVLAEAEVYRGALGKVKIDGRERVTVGTTEHYDAVMQLSYGRHNLSHNIRQVVKRGEAVWKSSNSSVMSVDSSGNAQAKARGSVRLSVAFADGEEASAAIKVKAPGIGDSLTKDDMVYKITGNGRTVKLVQCRKSGRVTVPNKVKFGKRYYQVEAIGKNAFRYNLGITKVTIGKNVRTIEKRAFYGCRTLQEIQLKTKKLQTVGSKAFAKTGVVRVKAPKGVRTKYKTMLRAKGLAKKVKFK